MDAADLPPEKPKVSEVKRMDDLPSPRNLANKVRMNDLMEKIKENATASSSGVNLQNEGQISLMRIPAGWVRSIVDQHPTASANYVELHNTRNPELRLGTLYRGQRISTWAGKYFQELLRTKEHNLDQTEYQALGEVLRDKAQAEDFDVSSKRTLDIQGRRVLMVEGEFKQIKQRSLSVYVDADGTGEVVQEIFYQGPEALYGEYRQSAEEAIKSIIWN